MYKKYTFSQSVEFTQISSPGSQTFKSSFEEKFSCFYKNKKIVSGFDGFVSGYEISYFFLQNLLRPIFKQISERSSLKA